MTIRLRDWVRYDRGLGHFECRVWFMHHEHIDCIRYSEISAPGAFWGALSCK